MENSLHFNFFMRTNGHHFAAWRHPDAPADRLYDIDLYVEQALKAEEGLFNSLFLADGPSLGTNPWSYLLGPLEPMVLLSALSGRTERIGLVGTLSTTFHEPYNVARFLASLDHVSHGRAAWNIVTTQSLAAAENFGLDHQVIHQERYQRAEEFVDAVTALLLSWAPDALVVDREAGIFVDPEKITAPHYVGEIIRVEGALNVAPSPQRKPLYVQAGSSEAGMALGARVADAIFTSQHSMEDSLEFVGQIRGLAKGFGRNPDDIKILPGLAPILGSTVEEAKRLEQELGELTVPSHSIAQLSDFLNFDLTTIDIDEAIPVEKLPSNDDIQGHRSRNGVIRKIMDERPGMTVRDLVYWHIGGRGHRSFVGTPEQLADEIEVWHAAKACDGFNLMPSLTVNGLYEFVDHVVPLLQQKGIYRREPQGTTLRGSFGLSDVYEP